MPRSTLSVISLAISLTHRTCGSLFSSRNANTELRTERRFRKTMETGFFFLLVIDVAFVNVHAQKPETWWKKKQLRNNKNRLNNRIFLSLLRESSKVSIMFRMLLIFSSSFVFAFLCALISFVTIIIST